MVKFHKAQGSYPHPFPAVSLAYFLRYPNPYSTHVLSTDTISRHIDPATGRLHTVRLHLKQSKLPAVVARALPKTILAGGSSADGQARNFVLETTVVDARAGWMETETRNLQYTGVLTVIEQQRFSRAAAATTTATTSACDAPLGVEAALALPPSATDHQVSAELLHQISADETTDVSTTVTFVSRLGQAARATPQHQSKAAAADEPPKKPSGFLQSWSTAALQRTIEASGVQRTHNALVKSRKGMLVVLDRIRHGGVVAAVEGMRRDRELVVGAGWQPEQKHQAEKPE